MRRERSSGPGWLWLVAVALVLGAAVANADTTREKARRKLSRGELVKLARDVGFPDAQYAADIAMRESGGDPMALNDNPPIERSIGLWQINTLVHKKYSLEELTNPRRNAEYAYELSKRGRDWGPWATSKRRPVGPGPAPPPPVVTPGPPIEPGDPLPP